jgi:hypothetical protein
MKKLYSFLVITCLFPFIFFFSAAAAAENNDASPGQKLIAFAEKKRLLTADLKVPSPRLDAMSTERTALWDEKKALEDERAGLPAVERITNSVLNIKIASLESRIKDLDEKRKRHFFFPKQAGANQAYVDVCLAKIMKEGEQSLRPYIRGGFHGDTILTFYILPTGEIRKLRISNSLGRELLDEALVEAVINSSPCDQFSPQMAADLDFLAIVAPFEFGPKKPAHQDR